MSDFTDADFLSDFDDSGEYLERLALSTLLSLSAADALGAATEFKTAEAIRARYGDHITDYQFGNVFGFSPGEATDDTQMVVATLLGYQRGKRLEDILQAYQSWLGTNPPDVGKSIRHALSYNDLNGGVQAWSDSDYQSAGNGGLMRVAAVWLKGLSGLELTYSAATVTALTHADPRCVYASMFLVALLEALAEGQAFHDATHTALKLIDRSDARAMLMRANILGVHQLEAGRVFWEHEREARAQIRGRVLRALRADKEADKDERDETETPHTTHTVTQSGFVLDTLEAAMTHAVRATDWMSGVQPAVMAGEDSDTVACITGAILGARGFTVPENLLGSLRVGHTWSFGNDVGWNRGWKCTEHYPVLLQKARST